MVVRLNEEGKIVTEGSQVQLGGNDVYKVVCRRHFRKLTNLI
jgi:thymidine kinase